LEGQKSENSWVKINSITRGGREGRGEKQKKKKRRGKNDRRLYHHKLILSQSPNSSNPDEVPLSFYCVMLCGVGYPPWSL